MALTADAPPAPAPASPLPLRSRPPSPSPKARLGPLLAKGAAPLVLTVLILLIPRPEAVQPHGWAVFAIFAGTILGLILRPLPLGAVALVGLTATMLSKTLEPEAWTRRPWTRRWTCA